jgi:hypothetical protein
MATAELIMRLRRELSRQVFSAVHARSAGPSVNDTVGTPGRPLGCSRLALCPAAQARSRTMASPSGRKPTSVR